MTFSKSKDGIYSVTYRFTYRLSRYDIIECVCAEVQQCGKPKQWSEKYVRRAIKRQYPENYYQLRRWEDDISADEASTTREYVELHVSRYLPPASERSLPTTNEDSKELK